jgi:hypothetical protein
VGPGGSGAVAEVAKAGWCADERRAEGGGWTWRDSPEVLRVVRAAATTCEGGSANELDSNRRFKNASRHHSLLRPLHHASAPIRSHYTFAFTKAGRRCFAYK